MKHKYLLYTFALASALVLQACSDDSAGLVPDAPGKEDASKLVDVNFSISTRALGSLVTRNGENTAPDGSTVDIYGTTNEHINDWFMILVHAGDHASAGNIAKIIKRSAAGVANSSVAVTREAFNIPGISEGTYHIYTFGNIEFDHFKQAIKDQYNVEINDNTETEHNIAMPDIKDMEWTYFHNQLISNSENVPLCSVDSDLEVDDALSIEIELERVIGKIQFYFADHTTSQSLKIKKFSMLPIRTKSYLLEHDVEGGLVATPPHEHDDAKETISMDFGSSPWLVAKHTDNLFTKCADLGYYVNESVPEVSEAYPLGHFHLRLELERELSNGTTLTEKRSSMMHSLTAIERNQFYLQPIMFTDWVLQPEIHYYPPIGGYPVVQIEESSSFEECYSTFKDVTSSSPFQIRLRIHDLADPDKWYDVTDGIKVKDKVTVGGVQREQPYMVIVHDPDNVIDHTTLSLDNSGLIKSPDGQLTGHFTGKKGRAIISVYANIEISTGVYYTYERDLYIITK